MRIPDLEEIFNQSPGFFAVLRGPDFVFERVNEAYLTLVGGRDPIGKRLLDALPEIQGQGFIELLTGVLATGEPFVARAVCVSIAKGPGQIPEEIFVDLIYAPLRSDDGKVAGIITYGSDVTQQVLGRRQVDATAEELTSQVEEAQVLAEELEQSNEQLQKLNAEMEEAKAQAEEASSRVIEVLDSLGESVFLLDKTWKVRYLNPVARSIIEKMGVEAENIVGKVLWEELPELAGTLFESETRRAAKENQTVEYEAFMGTAGGWFETRVVPSKSGVTTFSRDVTERYKSAEALARSEEQFRLLANLIPTLAWMADETGWIFWYNERWYQYTGKTAPQMEGWGWQSVHDPDILPAVMEKWSASIATGEPFEMEFPLRSESGDFRWFLTRVAPLRNESEKVVRWFGTNTDVQAQHEAAIAAQAANKAKSDFLAAMSHETRQPINATLSFLELLEMGIYGQLADEQKTAIDRIRKNQEQLLSVITDILSFARLEAGHVELATVPVSCRRIVADLPALVEPQVLAKGISFSTECSQEDPIALGDREKILQILTNLVTNAIRATPERGRITVRCGRRNGVVEFKVNDTGVGIPSGRLEDIFSPFVQLERALNRPREGVGLGLAISRDFAIAMGGSLTATSSPGNGSTFTLSLPSAPTTDKVTG